MEPTRSQRILVVDDEPSIVDAVATSLRYEGFGVDEAVNGRLALAAAQEHPPDLIVLDVMLPDLDGLEVTRRLRADGIRVPILFLTARDAVEDKVAGLTVGGDDYVTKPFALAEIVARVHAILRRIGSEPEDEGILRFADIEMDESAHEVTRAGQPIALTATEFNLLRFFLLNPRHVLSKAQILDHVWHYDFGGDGNVVETYVSYLRKKLEAVGPPVIHTVRLVGYALREPASGRRPVSLRTRLLIAIGVIALVALAVADVVTYSSLESFLYQRVDQQLDRSPTGPSSSIGRTAAELALRATPLGPGPGSGDPVAAVAGRRCRRRRRRRPSTRSRSYAVEVRTPIRRRGQRARAAPAYVNGTTYTPADPRRPSPGSPPRRTATQVAYFTAPSTSAGGPAFRVRASILDDGDCSSWPSRWATSAARSTTCSWSSWP